MYYKGWIKYFVIVIVIVIVSSSVCLAHTMVSACMITAT